MSIVSPGGSRISRESATVSCPIADRAIAAGRAKPRGLGLVLVQLPRRVDPLHVQPERQDRPHQALERAVAHLVGRPWALGEKPRLVGRRLPVEHVAHEAVAQAFEPPADVDGDVVPRGHLILHAIPVRRDVAVRPRDGDDAPPRRRAARSGSTGRGGGRRTRRLPTGGRARATRCGPASAFTARTPKARARRNASVTSSATFRKAGFGCIGSSSFALRSRF